MNVPRGCCVNRSARHAHRGKGARRHGARCVRGSCLRAESRRSTGGSTAWRELSSCHRETSRSATPLTAPLCATYSLQRGRSWSRRPARWQTYRAVNELGRRRASRFHPSCAPHRSPVGASLLKPWLQSPVRRRACRALRLAPSPACKQQPAHKPNSQAARHGLQRTTTRTEPRAPCGVARRRRAPPVRFADRPLSHASQLAARYTPAPHTVGASPGSDSSGVPAAEHECRGARTRNSARRPERCLPTERPAGPRPHFLSVALVAAEWRCWWRCGQDSSGRGGAARVASSRDRATLRMRGPQFFRVRRSSRAARRSECERFPRAPAPTPTRRTRASATEVGVVARAATLMGAHTRHFRIREHKMPGSSAAPRRSTKGRAAAVCWLRVAA